MRSTPPIPPGNIATTAPTTINPTSTDTGSTDTGSTDTGSRNVPAELAFLLLALAPVVAVLSLPVLVVQDGGLHLSSASTLGYLFTGEFSDVIAPRPGLPPNLTVELLLLGLLQVASPVWALKLLVVAVLLGFAAAAWRLVVAAGAPGPWAVLLLPFAWHRPLAWGFVGFAAAVALALLSLAVVLRRPTAPPVGLLAGLLVTTWFTHLVPAVVGTACCLAVVIAGRLSDRQRGIPGGRALRGMMLAATPVLLLTAAFVVLNPPGASEPRTESLLRRVEGVVGMTRATVSTAAVENEAYQLLALVLYAAAAAIVLVRWRAGWRWCADDALLAAAVLGDVVAVVAPEGVSGAGGYLGLRITLFPSLLLAAWVAAQLGTVRWRRGRLPALAVAVAVGLMSLLLVAVRLPAQTAFSGLVAEMIELQPCLPGGSTVMQLTLDDASSRAARMEPLADQVGFLTAARGALDMGNESGWVPYYLWQYRDGQRPDLLLGTQLGGLSAAPPRIDVAGALRTGLRLDAIMVVGRPSADPIVLDDGPTRQALADVAANYRRVAVSSGATAELWLRNGIAGSCAP